MKQLYNIWGNNAEGQPLYWITERGDSVLTKREKEIVIRCAKRYKVASVFLFGSSVASRRNGNDIDLGVKGIQPKLFFKLYAELFRNLSRPVDLVDLDSEDNYFTERIIKGGKIIYEA